MKLLVLSDVHGNQFGLQAVLRASRQCNAVLCLGDIVDYGAHPNECCELLRECGAVCLSGNHDAGAVGLLERTRFRPLAQVANAWTAERLTEDNAHWLASLPGELHLPHWSLQAVHASLREPRIEYIIGRSVSLPTFERMVEPLCFYGHTHESDYYSYLDVPGKRFQHIHTTLPHGGNFALEPEWKYLVNPGSCGQPRDGNVRARYGVFDSDEQTVEIFEVDYDVEAACAAILATEMPSVFAERLRKAK